MEDRTSAPLSSKRTSLSQITEQLIGVQSLDLLAASHARAEERMRKLNAQRAAEAARKKAKEEADRALFLDQLAKREKAVWKQVDAYHSEAAAK